MEDMKAKAEEMGIEGVATASVLNKGETVDWIGEMKVVGTPYKMKEGWNLVAIAWSKCGEVIATEADSGNPNHKKINGELGYVGGAYDEFQGCKMAFAFSGATSEEQPGLPVYLQGPGYPVRLGDVRHRYGRLGAGTPPG
ncbi:MAG: hypothetical protein J5490_01675 [Bacteroidales bacterium]|nr:hypothetical protein [Bacteroidales bacterium]